MYYGEKVEAEYGMKGGYMYTKDWDLSAQQGTIVQRGLYTLNAGAADVYLPTPLISAASAANIVIMLTPRTNNPVFVNTIISALTLGSVLISSVSGFRVSGSGSDSGYWMALGYR